MKKRYLITLDKSQREYLKEKKIKLSAFVQKKINEMMDLEPIIVKA